MKKIVSLLLALVMVLSLGVAAFADGAEAGDNNEVVEETPTVTVDEILAWVKDSILPALNLDLLKAVINETKATIDNIVKILAPIFGKETNPDAPEMNESTLAEIPAKVMNFFIDGLAKILNVSREELINKLLEIPFIKWIMGWYGYKPATPTTAAPTEAPTEAPATEVPDTGATAALAAVASLSVAAAAAFVSKKKAA